MLHIPTYPPSPWLLTLMFKKAQIRLIQARYLSYDKTPTLTPISSLIPLYALFRGILVILWVSKSKIRVGMCVWGEYVVPGELIEAMGVYSLPPCFYPPHLFTGLYPCI